MIKKTKLAKAIAYATVGAAITAGSMTNASASSTIYNVNSPYASNIVTGGTGTDGWTASSGGDNPDIGWTSASAPFGTTAWVVNWAAEITATGDSLTISSQDAHTRYGIWADIDTAKGAWSDTSSSGAQGWLHDTDMGLFKSDVSGTVTLGLQGILQSGTDFGFTIFKGMDSVTRYAHHNAWNADNNVNGITANSSPYNSTHFLGTTLSLSDIVANSVGGSTPENINTITFDAEAGQIYSIFLSGYRNGSWGATNDGYSLTVSQTPAPVPGTVWLFSGALAGLAGIKRKKLKA